VKLFSSKRRLIATAAVILSLLFLLRPGASRLKSKIAGSISAAVGRPVEIGNVHIRLLPQPGFDLENLVVYDDPAFGAEPMLRAGEVTAILRLTSLARGRLEIARLDLTEPSLNLVHADNGRWNLEALLERAAQTPLAPTGMAKPGPRPEFPYIEASSGRINFKTGPEKKPYALTNADFALWQDSENTWGVRLRAQPFRTDMNLSDTGVLRVSGSWRRATSIRETPLQFSLEWDRPQLGQLTKFFTGGDKGWRGEVLLDANLTGTPSKLQVGADASIRDFRRYDISSGEALRLAAHCDSQYSSLDHVLHELACRAPVGNGSLTLRGSIGLPRSHQYDLVALADNVPAGAVVALARHAKKNLPEDLTATGSVVGSFWFRRSGASESLTQFEGRGKIGGLRLFSAKARTQVSPGDIQFELTSRQAEGRPGRNTALKGVSLASASGPQIEFGPFAMATDVLAPAVRGWVNRSGYGVSLAGDMDIARAQEAARLFDIPVIAATAEGTAQVELQIAGSWPEWASGIAGDSSRSNVTGTVKLRNVRANLRGVDGPLEISSAELHLLPEEVRVAKFTAKAAHAVWTGSLQLPRGCGTPRACLMHFDLSTNEVALDELSWWVSPGPKEQPWYRTLTSVPQTRPPFLATLHASGRVVANRLLLRDLVATHVSTHVSLEDGELRLSELRGGVFGGEQRGAWEADFRTTPPSYNGEGILTGISLERAAEAMKDEWIAGTANAQYRVTASGVSGVEFWRSAEGNIQLGVENGVLPRVSLLSDGGRLTVERFEGRARLHEGTFEIKDGRLESPLGIFAVNGTASLHRELDLKLTRRPLVSAGSRSPGYTITGTIAEPQVVPMASPDTRAQLKP
jgi:hypothetical protein